MLWCCMRWGSRRASRGIPDPTPGEGEMLYITAFQTLRHLRRLQQFQRRLGSTDSTADQCSSEIPRLTAPQIWPSPCPTPIECRQQCWLPRGRI
jgi:hypothetical protein